MAQKACAQIDDGQSGPKAHIEVASVVRTRAVAGKVSRHANAARVGQQSMSMSSVLALRSGIVVRSFLALMVTFFWPAVFQMQLVRFPSGSIEASG
jgi:hypothetical protein